MEELARRGGGGACGPCRGVWLHLCVLCVRASERESERACLRARARVCVCVCAGTAFYRATARYSSAHGAHVHAYNMHARTCLIGRTHLHLTVTARPLEQTHSHARTHTHKHTADTSVGRKVKIHGQRGCVCGETPMRARMGACGCLFAAAVPCPGDHTVYVCIYVCMCIYGGLRACVCCCCTMRRCAFGL
jgi:hypothetical protein